MSTEKKNVEEETTEGDVPEVETETTETVETEEVVSLEATPELVEQAAEAAAKMIEARNSAAKKFYLSPSASANAELAHVEKRAKLNKWVNGVLTKAIDTSSASAIVPIEFDRDIYAVFDEYSQLISAADIKVMSSNQMNLNELVSKTIVYKQAEMSATTGSNPTYNDPILNVEDYVGSSVVSSQLLDDSEIDLAADLARQFGERLAARLQTSLATSTGAVSNPSNTASQGIFVNPGVTTVSQTTTGSYLNTTWQDLNRLRAALASTDGYLGESGRGSFYMSPALWFTLLGVTGTDSHFIAGGPIDPVAQTVWGRPVVLLNEAPIPTTTANNFVVYGELSRHLVVGRRKEMEMRVNTQGTAADGTNLNSTFAREFAIHARFAQAIANANGLVALRT